MSKAQDYWSFFAEEARRAQSPLYARLAEGAGQRPDLQALAGRAKKGQPHANLLFGAVHFLLLRGADHPLKAYYATLGGTRAADEGDAFALFADFVAQYGAALAPLIETRATNTNEVGRSALLHPGFRAVAAEAGAPLALIEIGPSAGLNMVWDRYGVRYHRDGAVAAGILPDAAPDTAPDSGLVIDCEARGPVLPLTGPAPSIASRMGLELNPNDLSDPVNRDWLRALVWPEHVARLRRLERAMALAAAAENRIVFGDALDNLLAALREIPPGAVPCVYHTVVTYQFSDAMRQTLSDLLTVAGLRGPVFRLGFEWAGGHANHLSQTRYQDGQISQTLLAEGHPHGAWIEWKA